VIVHVVTLTRPIDHDGKKIEVINLDFDRLTGADILLCAREASAAKGEAVRVLVIDTEFHVHVAAAASGIDAAVLKKLGAVDFVEVATAVQGFLTQQL
jgi:hypothetical protein